MAKINATARLQSATQVQASAVANVWKKINGLITADGHATVVHEDDEGVDVKIGGDALIMIDAESAAALSRLLRASNLTLTIAPEQGKILVNLYSEADL